MIAILLAGATVPILEHLDGMAESTTVLDLACGTGEPAARILAEHPTWRLIGVDTAQTVLVAARDRVPDERADFRLGSMTDLDLLDNSVDAPLRPLRSDGRARRPRRVVACRRDLEGRLAALLLVGAAIP